MRGIVLQCHNGSMNRLARERSPYLLQHAHNPVDWFPWGDEAFARARERSCPIFLSIGYSTCHWCHVMERESFENAEVAAVLNAHFVSIKVDREERLADARPQALLRRHLLPAIVEVGPARFHRDPAAHRARLGG